ncbi:hypothetical protein JCM10207_003130 [Rhodosporidiobolus poonsookiae]
MLLPSLIAAVVALAHLSSAAATLDARRMRTCVPDLEAGEVLNVFRAGQADEAWEFLPSTKYPTAVTGGAVYLSQTDTPENGGWYLSEVEGQNGTFTLSLASQEAGVQCLRTVGKNRAVTTGPCDQLKSTFTLTCTTCPSSSASSSSADASARYLARACTFTSLASPGYCLQAVAAAGSPGLGQLEARKCAARSRAQAWDLVRA